MLADPAGSSDFLRPAIPSPSKEDPRRIAAVGLLLAGVVFWVFGPLWPVLDSHILGDAETDAIRGMWSFDHIRRSLWWPDTPLRSFELNYPGGVWAVMLPFATGLLLVPAQIVLGPQLAWNVAILGMVWATGMATAWLTRTVSGSWAAGAIAGAVVASQPMLIHAVSDGTPEHVAFWGVPVFLASATRALDSRNPRWGIVTGLAGLLVALDSPYHAIYTAVVATIVLPWALLRTRRDQLRGLAWTGLAMGAALAVGVLVIGSVYRLFPLESTNGTAMSDLWRMNAADIHTWWQYDWGPASGRDPSLTPTYIPSIALAAAVALALYGGRRSWPWLAAGSLTLVMSFGINTRIPGELSRWFDNAGRSLGEALLTLNSYLYALPGIGSVRFPQRWLVVAALCFFVAAGVGYARLGRRWPRAAPSMAVVLAVLATAQATISSGLHDHFPMHELPEVEFASWIGERDGHGVVVVIPSELAAPAAGEKRADMVVFASIEGPLSSSDQQYFQVLHRRPITTSPSLKTLIKRPMAVEYAELMGNWNDLTQPKQTGNPIPRSAYDSPDEDRRSHTIDLLHQGGLRWVVIDLALFTDEGVDILRKQLGDRIAHEEHFDDGSGVLVFELEEAS